MTKQRFLWISAICITIFILIASLFPTSGNSINLWHLDKVGHFLAYFIFSINLCFLFKKKNKRITFLILAIFLGVILEIIQFYIPGRDRSIYDGIINTIGVGMGTYLFQVKKKWMNRVLSLIHI